MNGLRLIWNVFWHSTVGGTICGLGIGALIGFFSVIALILLSNAGFASSDHIVGMQMSIIWIVTGTLGGILYGGLTGFLAGIANGLAVSIVTYLMLSRSTSLTVRSRYPLVVRTVTVLVVGFSTLCGCLASGLPTQLADWWGWGIVGWLGLVLWAVIPSLLAAGTGWVVGDRLASKSQSYYGTVAVVTKPPHATSGRT